jgi:hypothetical protein
MCCGNDTYIDMDLSGSTNGVDGALLQHAQQFDLHVQRHVANFIQENGAAMGQFKASNSVCHSTREGTFAVSKKFTFE